VGVWHARARDWILAQIIQVEKRAFMNTTELQERLNTLADRKRELATKPWFRALQVIYACAFILAGGFVALIALSIQSLEIFIIGAALTYGLFYSLRKVTYYIILGSAQTVKPDPEHLLENKFKK